ncbi:MAG TPA: hypothetical protein EYP09_09335 [Anaerolineae bacterium]|nr:hypothetical protein [Anaerolineae bacterium]
MDIVEGQAPGRAGAAGVPTSSDHVEAAVGEHAGHVGLRRLTEHRQQGSLGRLRIGIGQPQHVQGVLRQHHPRSEQLPGGPHLFEDTDRRPNHQSSRLQIVHPTPAPGLGPIPYWPWGPFPEAFIFGQTGSQHLPPGPQRGVGIPHSRLCGGAAAEGDPDLGLPIRTRLQHRP